MNTIHVSVFGGHLEQPVTYLKAHFPTAALPARAERPIFITWKISRAGTPRKLNVVLLSRVYASRQADKKMRRLDNYSLQKKLNHVRSARAGKAAVVEIDAIVLSFMQSNLIVIWRHSNVRKACSIQSAVWAPVYIHTGPPSWLLLNGLIDKFGRAICLV